eukprot:2384494-Prymnesium_polylepis.1
MTARTPRFGIVSDVRSSGKEEGEREEEGGCARGWPAREQGREVACRQRDQAVPRVPLGSAQRDDEHGVPGGRPHGQRRGRPT